MAKKKEMWATLEDLQAEIDLVMVQLSEAMTNGTSRDIARLTAQLHTCEQAMNDAYYRRWGTP